MRIYIYVYNNILLRPRMRNIRIMMIIIDCAAELLKKYERVQYICILL